MGWPETDHGPTLTGRTRDGGTGDREDAGEAERNTHTHTRSATHRKQNAGDHSFQRDSEADDCDEMVEQR